MPLLRISENANNPFGNIQAREYSRSELIRTFFPTPVYWDRFNRTHEILLGTRGSGKTSILKMMSYRCLKGIEDQAPRADITSTRYIGFLMSTNLEYVKAIERHYPASRTTEYFRFIFNATAIIEFLCELRCVLYDHPRAGLHPADTEYRITQCVAQHWFSTRRQSFRDFNDIEIFLRKEMFRTPQWLDGERRRTPAFSRGCLDPIDTILPVICQIAGLDSEDIVWIACIDEVEFVPEPYLACLNTPLRSRKNHLVVKMATLPYRTTTKTSKPSEHISEMGGDFKYRRIDFEPNSHSFVGLADHICNVRLRDLNGGADICLEDFVGVNGGKQGLTGVYLREKGLKLRAGSIERHLLKGIVESFPEHRAKKLRVKYKHAQELDKPLERYRGSYIYRELYRERGRGHRKLGLFAGAEVCRQVSEGNPRRFCELMGALFDAARASKNRRLENPIQHEVIVAFCRELLDSSEALPEWGWILRQLLEFVVERLRSMAHDEPLRDVGLDFSLPPNALNVPGILEAVQLGVQFSHLETITGAVRRVGDLSHIRLAYAHAINAWIPPRKGGNRISMILNSLPPAAEPDNRHLYKRFARDLFDRTQPRLQLKEKSL